MVVVAIDCREFIMNVIREYLGQQLERPSSHESKLTLELLRLIQVVHREREYRRVRLRAIKRRVLSWTQGRVKRESQLLWDARIRASLLTLEETRRSDVERLPQVLERAILLLAGEVCSEVVQRPDWLRREINRLVEFLKGEFPYLCRDDRGALVIAVSKGSNLSSWQIDDNDNQLNGLVKIVEDDELMPGDLKVSRGGIGISICRGEIIRSLRS